MDHYGSSCVFMGSYSSLYVLMRPYGSLCVVICFYRSFKVLVNSNEALIVLIGPYIACLHVHFWKPVLSSSA